MSKNISGFWGAVVLFLSFCMGLPVVAAETTPSGRDSRSTLEEVIVTARKREENIQQTPVAVTAISGDDLLAKGITSFADLEKSVPSLQTGNSKSSQIYIRGIGQRTADTRVDPAVSVYLDGILIPRLEGAMLDTIDIESVQVLRGPQGTLFGKNNNGGALVIGLRKPEQEFSGFVDATLGNLGTEIFKAGVNVPLADNFAVRAAISSTRNDGTFKNISNGRRYNEDDRTSIAFQSLWDVSDTLSIKGLLFLDKHRSTTHTVNCRINNEDALLIKGLGVLWSGDRDPANPQAYVENCEENSQEVLADYETNLGDPEAQKLDLDAIMTGFTLIKSLSETAELKVVTGYRTETVGKGKLLSDNDGGPDDFSEGMLRDDSDRTSLTLELQFTESYFDGALDFSTGFFAQHSTANDPKLMFNSFQGLTSVTLAGLAAGQDTSTLGPLIANADNTPLLSPLLGGPNILDDFEIEGMAFGLYAQTTWHISEQWELTVGGRFNQEVKKSNREVTKTDLAALEAMITAADPRFQSTQAPGFMTYAGPWSDDPVGLINSTLPDTDGDGYYNTPLLSTPEVFKDEARFSDFTPMVSLSWFIPEEFFKRGIIDAGMVYFTWSNGFKSGFMEPAGVDGLELVEPEELENIELGFKIDAFDNSLRVNMAVYDMAFENMQLIQVTSDSSGALVVRYQNAGKARINGAEIEMSWLPIPGLMVSASYGKNNYRFIEFDDLDLAAIIGGNSVSLDRSDENFPVSPEESGSIGVQYEILSEYGTFTPRIDYSYKGEVYLGFDDGSWSAYKRDKSLASAKSYTLLDLRLSWLSPEGDLSVAAFVRNALDDVYDIGSVSVGSSLGTFTTIQGLPRTFGINVRRTF